MPERKCRLFHVDAFTRERFCGNPAVVVLDGLAPGDVVVTAGVQALRPGQTVRLAGAAS